jgi:hypothetical protein
MKKKCVKYILVFLVLNFSVLTYSFGDDDIFTQVISSRNGYDVTQLNNYSTENRVYELKIDMDNGNYFILEYSRRSGVFFMNLFLTQPVDDTTLLEIRLKTEPWREYDEMLVLVKMIDGKIFSTPDADWRRSHSVEVIYTTIGDNDLIYHKYHIRMPNGYSSVLTYITNGSILIHRETENILLTVPEKSYRSIQDFSIIMEVEGLR